MPTKRFPRHSAAWCRHQLDLLRARDQCRRLASERDHLIQKIQDLGGRRPKNIDSAIQVDQANARLRYILTDLWSARYRAEAAAEACGEDAGVVQYIEGEERREYGPPVKLNVAPRAASRPSVSRTCRITSPK
jgi:hypothetical protein